MPATVKKIKTKKYDDDGKTNIYHTLKLENEEINAIKTTQTISDEFGSRNDAVCSLMPFYRCYKINIRGFGLCYIDGHDA